MKIERFAMLLVSIVAVICILSISLVYLSFNTQKQTLKMSTISVSASGYASAIPAIAQISIDVNSTGATPEVATANLSSTINAINASIYQYQNGSKLQTEYYSVYRSTYALNNSNTTPRKTIYLASEILYASVPISKLNDAITSLSSVNNIEIDGITPKLSSAQNTQLSNIALSNALVNATQKAQLLAGSAAIYIQNISSYQSYYSPYPIPQYSMYSASYPIVSYGNSTVTQTVSVIYRYAG